MCVHEAKLKNKNYFHHLQLVIKLNDVHAICLDFKKAEIFWIMNIIGFLKGHTRVVLQILYPFN